jgi:hypothetical protein
MAVPLAPRPRRTLDQRMSARDVPAASRRRSELTAQSGVDKLDVFRVATDVRGGERAGGNDGLAARPDVIERCPDQHAAQSFALPSLVDLGVGDDDAVAGGLVLRPSDQLAVDAQLESAIARVVLHDPAHRVTVARGGTERTRCRCCPSRPQSGSSRSLRMRWRPGSWSWRSASRPAWCPAWPAEGVPDGWPAPRIPAGARQAPTDAAGPAQRA